MARRAILWRAAVALLLAATVLAAWQLLPVADYTRLGELRDLAREVRESDWAALLVVALFVLGSLLFLPLTVMVVATVLTFGPVDGFLLANAGTIASSLILFLIGYLLGAKPLRRLSGPLLTRLDRRARRHGILLVTALRVLPVAHFHLVSLVSGASRIRLLDYCLGTALGTVPGILAIAAVGNQAKRFLLDPDPRGLIVLTLLAAVSVVMIHYLRRWLQRYTAADGAE